MSSWCKGCLRVGTFERHPVDTALLSCCYFLLFVLEVITDTESSLAGSLVLGFETLPQGLRYLIEVLIQAQVRGCDLFQVREPEPFCLLHQCFEFVLGYFGTTNVPQIRLARDRSRSVYTHHEVEPSRAFDESIRNVLGVICCGYVQNPSVRFLTAVERKRCRFLNVAVLSESGVDILRQGHDPALGLNFANGRKCSNSTCVLVDDDYDPVLRDDVVAQDFG